MIYVIQYLENNPELVSLLKAQKASLVGISSVEQKAILDAFSCDIEWKSEAWV
ncbi:competence protein ComX [Lysinibacillus sphaericus]|uniref:competence pheromone ComX n=1 Tax=Lysinibacillus sphaericus TaxID=1421 RepID=UPI0018CD00A7|nr:competence pheromone ComX [Lysinibacillus sphaericus]MBG9455471.1 competence protein ComX [Lysinibacillus sphaericus]MBG9477888.1 competence protein ComX [Lysinibacillus sphaericus]MBG9594028.1 competence protein ComX [Lysinibacillus sphaericus]